MRRRQTQRDRGCCGVEALGEQRVGYQVPHQLREVLQRTGSTLWLCRLGTWLGQELFPVTPCCPAAFLGVAMPLLPHTLSGTDTPWGPCAAGVSPGQAGQEWLLLRSRSTRGDSDQRQQQAPTPAAIPRTLARKHPGDAPAKPLAGRRVLGRAPAAGTCRKSVPITLPSIPALPRAARQRAHAHCLCVPGPGTARWVPSLQWAAWVGWGAAYLLPRGMGSVRPGTGPQAPRVSV